MVWHPLWVNLTMTVVNPNPHLWNKLLKPMLAYPHPLSGTVDKTVEEKAIPTQTCWSINPHCNLINHHK